MGPIPHLVSAAAAGTVLFAATRDPLAAFAGAAAAVAPDADHFAEYFAYIKGRRKKWDRSEFWSGQYFRTKGTIYILLHGYEYIILLASAAILLCFLYPPSVVYVLPFLAGYTVHLLLDFIGNKCSRFAYFLIYRRHVQWRTDIVCGGE